MTAPTNCPEAKGGHYVLSFKTVSSLSPVSVVKLANVAVVYADGVELVAVQDEGFARALCLNSEEVREEVGRVEVRGCGLFGLLFVIRDRGKVRKLKLVVEGEVRDRVGRVGRARVAQVERDALPLEAHPPAGRSLCGARVASACGCLEPRDAVKVRLRFRV